MRTVSAFAPASVANFGVGFDLLGAALDGLGDVVHATASARPGVRVVSITGDGGRLPANSRRNCASVAAAHVLADAGEEAGIAGIDVAVAKGLPLSSGMGSSAASAAAGAMAAGLLLGVRDKERLLLAALEGEHAADGSWHGDNVFSSLLGGLVLVPSSDPTALRPPLAVPFPKRLRLVVVHPELELTTRDARRVLPKSIPLPAHVRQSGALAELILALSRGDLAAAGRCLEADRVVDTARAPLVPGFVAVREAMKRAGAFGVSLAGAGPSVVALAEAETRGTADGANRIARAGVRAWRRAGVAATAGVHRIDARGARRLLPRQGR